MFHQPAPAPSPALPLPATQEEEEEEEVQQGTTGSSKPVAPLIILRSVQFGGRPFRLRHLCAGWPPTARAAAALLLLLFLGLAEPTAKHLKQHQQQLKPPEQPSFRSSTWPPLAACVSPDPQTVPPRRYADLGGAEALQELTSGRRRSRKLMTNESNASFVANNNNKPGLTSSTQKHGVGVDHGTISGLLSESEPLGPHLSAELVAQMRAQLQGDRLMSMLTLDDMISKSSEPFWPRPAHFRSTGVTAPIGTLSTSSSDYVDEEGGSSEWSFGAEPSRQRDAPSGEPLEDEEEEGLVDGGVTESLAQTDEPVTWALFDNLTTIDPETGATIDTITNLSLDPVTQTPFARWSTITIAVLIGLCVLLTVFGNILVLMSFVYERTIRQPSNYFICSLALSDLSIGIVSMPLFAIYVLRGWRWTLGPFWCDLWLATDHTLCLVSIYTVLLITVDRFFSIKAPTKYREWRTKRKVIIMVIITWLVPFAIFFGTIMSWDWITGKRDLKEYECAVQFLKNPVFNTSLILFYFYSTLAIMFVLYAGIYKTARDLAKKSENKQKRMQLMMSMQQQQAEILARYMGAGSAGPAPGDTGGTSGSGGLAGGVGAGVGGREDTRNDVNDEDDDDDDQHRHRHRGSRTAKGGAQRGAKIRLSVVNQLNDTSDDYDRRFTTNDTRTPTEDSGERPLASKARDQQHPQGTSHEAGQQLGDHYQRNLLVYTDQSAGSRRSSRGRQQSQDGPALGVPTSERSGAGLETTLGGGKTAGRSELASAKGQGAGGKQRDVEAAGHYEMDHESGSRSSSPSFESDDDSPVGGASSMYSSGNLAAGALGVQSQAPAQQSRALIAQLKAKQKSQGAANSRLLASGGQRARGLFSGSKNQAASGQSQPESRLAPRPQPLIPRSPIISRNEFRDFMKVGSSAAAPSAASKPPTPTTNMNKELANEQAKLPGAGGATQSSNDSAISSQQAARVELSTQGNGCPLSTASNEPVQQSQQQCSCLCGELAGKRKHSLYLETSAGNGAAGAARCSQSLSYSESLQSAVGLCHSTEALSEQEADCDDDDDIGVDGDADGKELERDSRGSIGSVSSLSGSSFSRQSHCDCCSLCSVQTDSLATTTNTTTRTTGQLSNSAACNRLLCSNQRNAARNASNSSFLSSNNQQVQHPSWQPARQPNAKRARQLGSAATGVVGHDQQQQQQQSKSLITLNHEHGSRSKRDLQESRQTTKAAKRGSMISSPRKRPGSFELGDIDSEQSACTGANEGSSPAEQINPSKDSSAAVQHNLSARQPRAHVAVAPEPHSTSTTLNFRYDDSKRSSELDTTQPVSSSTSSRPETNSHTKPRGNWLGGGADSRRPLEPPVRDTAGRRSPRRQNTAPSADEELAKCDIGSSIGVTSLLATAGLKTASQAAAAAASITFKSRWRSSRDHTPESGATSSRAHTHIGSEQSPIMRTGGVMGKPRFGQRHKSKSENRARKALRTISFILGAFVLCWTPYHILALVTGFCTGHCVNTHLFYFTYFLCYTNSPINPFCYALANAQFKRAFYRILKCNFGSWQQKSLVR